MGYTAAALRSSTSFNAFSFSSSPIDDSNRASNLDKDIVFVDIVGDLVIT